MSKYSEELKKEIVRQHIKDERSLKSLSLEYHVSKAGISNWVKQYRNECQTNQEAKHEYDYMEEMKKLRRKNEELEKENLFLKKAAAFFAKEID
jgi:transposase